MDKVSGVPLFSLIRLDIPSYDPASCPLCAGGLPIVKPGTGLSSTKP